MTTDPYASVDTQLRNHVLSAGNLTGATNAAISATNAAASAKAAGISATNTSGNLTGADNISSGTTYHPAVASAHNRAVPNGLTLQLHVRSIDNGHLVSIWTGGTGVEPREIFISDMSELPDVLTAQIVASKIGV